MPTRKLVAFNTATQSENKIHDDEVAKRFGFTGGLVPGVDVYAYLSWGPGATWGEDWLTRGTMQARFSLPTYDGEEVEVEFAAGTAGGGEGRCELRNASGVVVAEGSAALPDVAPALPDLADYPLVAPVAERPPASPESLPEGLELASHRTGFHAARHGEYLAEAREVLPVYAERGIAHPGWVLRLANRILADNVLLGPWIHVGSRVQHHGTVPDGAEVVCRGHVAKSYEHKGHRFVELDLIVTADDRPVASIWHTAIYQPRQVRLGS